MRIRISDFKPVSSRAITCLLLLLIMLQPVWAGASAAGADQEQTSLHFNLDQCLALALENNRNRLVSRAAIDIAEAQYRQALSAYWPQVNARFAVGRLDEDPNFLFPERNFNFSLPSFPPDAGFGAGAGG